MACTGVSENKQTFTGRISSPELSLHFKGSLSVVLLPDANAKIVEPEYGYVVNRPK